MLRSVIVLLLIVVTGSQKPGIAEEFQQVVVPGSGEILCDFHKPLIDCNVRVSDHSNKKLFKKILDFGNGLNSQRVTLKGRGKIQAYASYAGKGLDKGHCGVTLEMVQPGLVVLVECSGQYSNNIWSQGYGLLVSDGSILLPSTTQSPIFEGVELGASLSVLLTANVPLDWCSVSIPSTGLVDITNGLPSSSRYSAHGAGIDQGDCGMTLNNLVKEDSGVWFWEAGVGSDNSKALQAVIVLVKDAPAADPVLDVQSLNNLQAGDLLVATCQAPPAAPPADISWFLDDKQVNTGEFNDKMTDKWPWEPQPVVQTFNHLLEAEDDGKKLECVMEHSSLSGGPRRVSQELDFLVSTTTSAPDTCLDAMKENSMLADEVKKLKKELAAEQNTASQLTSDLAASKATTASAVAELQSAKAALQSAEDALKSAQSAAATAEITCKSAESIASQLKADMATVKAATAGVGVVCKSAEDVASQLQTNMATAQTATSIADAARDIAEKIVTQATAYLATVQSATVSAQAAQQSATDIVSQATAYLVTVQSASSCADPDIVSKLKADLATEKAANFIADVARKSAINMASQAASDVIAAQAATLRAEAALKTAENIANKATSALATAQTSIASPGAVCNTAENVALKAELVTAQADTKSAETARKIAESIATKASADLVTAQVATATADAARNVAESVASQLKTQLATVQASTANAGAVCNTAENIALKAQLATAKTATASAEADRNIALSDASQLKTQLDTVQASTPSATAENIALKADLATAQAVTANAETARRSAESIAAQVRADLAAARAAAASADTARYSAERSVKEKDNEISQCRSQAKNAERDANNKISVARSEGIAEGKSNCPRHCWKHDHYANDNVNRRETKHHDAIINREENRRIILERVHGVRGG